MHQHDQGREPGCPACDVDAAIGHLCALVGVDKAVDYVEAQVRHARRRTQIPGAAPDGRTEPGTLVRLRRDASQFGRVVARAGEVAAVKWRPSGPHATANGGGWDVALSFGVDRRFPGFTDDYAKDEAGSFVVVEGKHDWLTVRSTDLEIVR